MSLLETLDKLREAGIEVVCALSLTDRMEKRDDGLSNVEMKLREDIRERLNTSL